MHNWTSLHQRAKALESRLESNVQKYSSVAQKINADFLCDGKNYPRTALCAVISLPSFHLSRFMESDLGVGIITPRRILSHL
jgi:hypothetical protein